MSQRIVINTCFGGFGLSDAAYEKLSEWGVPVRKYIPQELDPETGLYKPQTLNDGEVIFDRELTPPGECRLNDIYHRYKGRGSGVQGRYWDCWLAASRQHPLLLRLVDAMGEAVNSRYASLKIVEIPNSVEWEIDDYDGRETIREKHRSWS